MEENKKEDSHSRFFKEIEYSPEPWRRDFLFGQTKVHSHGHVGLSGAVTSDIIDSLSGAIHQNVIIDASGAEILNRIIGLEKAVIWYLRDEKTNELIINGSPSPNNIPQ